MTLRVKRNIILMATVFMSMIIIPILAVAGRSGDESKPAIGKASLAKKGEEIPQNGIQKTNQKFCVLDESTGNTFEVEDREFMYGAVVCEMPPSFEIEALKAQAVAAYTYFSREREKFRSKNGNENKPEIIVNTGNWHYYVTKDQMKNRWGDSFDKHYNKVKEAVDSVFGEVVKDDGELILAAYHAMSSGQTERCSDVFGGDLKYLVSVPSPGDRLVPNYKTVVSVSVEEFKNKILAVHKNCRFNAEPSEWVSDVTRTHSGMVKNLRVGSKEVKGTDIRKIFSLRSADFDISYQDDKFVFTVRGYGHGVGMSQCGAEYMAQQGADYKQILMWYYPNTTIEKI